MRSLYLRAGFWVRRPWSTRFVIGGRQYGGQVDYAADDHGRIDDFAESVPPCRVLELGSHEGWHTIQLAQRGYTVTAVEGRRGAARRARWIQHRHGVDAEVIVGNLETLRLRSLGRFDAIFCSGLLYHLPAPWRLIRQFPEVTGTVFVATHYADHTETVATGREGFWYTEGGHGDPLSGLSARSFWLTRPALITELERCGYTVRVLRDSPHPRGPLINLFVHSTATG